MDSVERMDYQNEVDYYISLIEKVYKALIKKFYDEDNNVKKEKIFEGPVGEFLYATRFKLSPMILNDVVERAMYDKCNIEMRHKELDGSDPYKVIGYISYWLAKLKPVLTMRENPDAKEIAVNEFLALNFAISFFEEKMSITISMEPPKFIEHLIYTMRYRTLTIRTLPLMYEAYVTGFNAGKLLADSSKTKSAK